MAQRVFPARPADPPARAWLVYNPSSRSTSDALVDTIRESLASNGVELAGETHFPDQDMPDGDTLAKHQVDTLIAFGGDGTITCAATMLADWGGRILAMPGGTMNLIPKLLHDPVEVEPILDTLFDRPRVRHLPFAAAEGHRSFARIVAGPASSFVHVREQLREGRIRAMFRALRYAWKLSWSRTIRMDASHEPYRAIFAHAEADGRMHIEGVTARGPMRTLRLAWAWVRNLDTDDQFMDRLERDRLDLIANRPVHLLFDGEEVILDAPVRLSPEKSELLFFTTREREGDPARTVSTGE